MKYRLKFLFFVYYRNVDKMKRTEETVDSLGNVHTRH